ncbi:hypothetical protein F966_02180 [Acinetobacter higginsii]|uniref:Uncharacterized protein n=1 Tax=Acinetobacter higginsii TaxID=70347 RepID=N8WBQ5_9GAMM|nr:hypothetical protein F966_02180 [Acinetobacter higginsii]
MNKSTFNKTNFDHLECPLCGTLRAPSRVVLTRDKKDVKYVSYKCQPDHVNHGDVYKWKIMSKGELVD